MTVRDDVTPQVLANGLTVVVADTTKCTRAWADHPAPLTERELEQCFRAVCSVFEKCGLKDLSRLAGETEWPVP
jgi:hypothetical protein